MNNLDTQTAKSHLNDLLALECQSISFGYQVLASISTQVEDQRLTQVRVLEASPVGARFLILLRGESKALTSIHDVVRDMTSADANSPLTDSEYIANVDEALVNAFYSLEKHRLGERLVILESQTVCGCLSAVSELLGHDGVHVMEIRVHRSSTGGAYAFLSGSEKQCTSAVEKYLCEPVDANRQVRIECVNATTQLIRRNFSLSGEA